MCGIAGCIDLSRSTSTDVLSNLAAKMGEAIAHRGPDDSGVWVDAKTGVALSHRRLSIIDTSTNGHQPMCDASKRYVIVYNGEIYNAPDLKKQLSAVRFNGHSDTEVLLAAISAWGLEKTLQQCNGMFAFALWDTRDRVLHLARDRMGQKPLYYGLINNTVLFASELKALHAHPAFQKSVDPEALALYTRYGYVPEPLSMFKGVHKVEPGCYVTLAINNTPACFKTSTYWSMSAQLNQPTITDQAAATTQLKNTLLDAVNIRMQSDVPLGAFLSGGMDSSLIVSMMQAQSARPVKTFTIGFYEKAFNEAGDGARVAKHLGTDHTELMVTPQDAMKVIPSLPTLYDEPFADVSQIPTFLVSQLARENVTVSLSGDGGDELFAGYNRHFWVSSLWERFGRYPSAVKKPVLALLKALPPRAWNALFAMGSPVLPSKFKLSNPGDKIHKLATMLSHNNPDAMYTDLLSMWRQPNSVLLNTEFANTIPTNDGLSFPDFVHKLLYLDTTQYLPGDILTKVDRASMGVSLEARAPFMDHRVVELAWQLPLSMKAQNNQGKLILRDILKDFIPQSYIDKPKMGFGVPIGDWLRGDLKSWASDLLSPARIQSQGFFDHTMVSKRWHEHVSGKRDWPYPLWNLLMFQAWLDQGALT